MTVECHDLRQAFTFDIPPSRKPAVGDYVRISGLVRIDPGLRKKSGMPSEGNLLYNHDPWDGSPIRNWVFFELRDPVWEDAVPPDVESALRVVLLSTGSIVSGWNGASSEDIQDAISAWETAVSVVRPILWQRKLEEEARNAPASIVRIEV